MLRWLWIRFFFGARVIGTNGSRRRDRGSSSSSSSEQKRWTLTRWIVFFKHNTSMYYSLQLKKNYTAKQLNSVKLLTFSEYSPTNGQWKCKRAGPVKNGVPVRLALRATQRQWPTWPVADAGGPKRQWTLSEGMELRKSQSRINLENKFFNSAS